MPADDMHPTPLPGLLIELDGRNRASLGKLARHRRYLANVASDGTITLTPVAVVPVGAPAGAAGAARAEAERPHPWTTLLTCHV